VDGGNCMFRILHQVLGAMVEKDEIGGTWSTRMSVENCDYSLSQ
jgi:hypothetical protein